VTGDVLRARGPGEVRAGRVLLVSMVAALGGFLFGLDTAVINGAVGFGHESGNSGSTAPPAAGSRGPAETRHSAPALHSSPPQRP
jgi:hypothetical protein